MLIPTIMFKHDFYAIWNVKLNLKICSWSRKYLGLNLFFCRSFDLGSLTPRVGIKGGGVTSRDCTASSNNQIEEPIKGLRQHYRVRDFISVSYSQIYISTE